MKSSRRPGDEANYYYYFYYCRGYQQQDAHEFMRYLLDKLHAELVEVMGRRIKGSSPHACTTTSVVSDIFGGLLQSDVSITLQFTIQEVREIARQIILLILSELERERCHESCS